MLTYESILQPLPPRDRLSLFSSFLPECNLLPPPGALWHALSAGRTLPKNASRRVMGRDCYWAVTFHLTPFFRLLPAPLPNLRERILRGGGKKRQTRWK